MERRIERALTDLDDLTRHLTQPLSDGVAVLRLAGDDRQDQQIERALREIGLFGRGDTSAFDTSRSSNHVSKRKGSTRLRARCKMQKEGRALARPSLGRLNPAPPTAGNSVTRSKRPTRDAVKKSGEVSICSILSRRLYEHPAPRGAVSERTRTMKVMVIVKATKNSEAGVMPSETAARRDGQVQRGAGQGRHHAGRRGAAPEREGQAHQVLGRQAHRRRRPVRRDQGARRGLLDLAGPVDRGGRRVGAPLPRPDARRGRRARDSSHLRSRGLRRGVHARAARAGRAPARRKSSGRRLSRFRGSGVPGSSEVRFRGSARPGTRTSEPLETSEPNHGTPEPRNPGTPEPRPRF